MRRMLWMGILFLLACGCRPRSHQPIIPSNLPLTPGASTPNPSPWIASSGTWTEEPIPSETTTQTALSSTPAIPTDHPGLVIHGRVTLEDGSGLPGVKIYRGYASYPGVQAAISDALGNYRSEFQPIPGDEMVRAWAELPGYRFEADESVAGIEPGVYHWRHYHGFEQRELNFKAIPAPQ